MADMKQLLMSKIKIYRDHPIPGQPFADIFPIFRDPKLTEIVIESLTSYIRATHDISKLSAIVCLESRGFFFAPMVALRLGLACIPVRKNGKLPGQKVTLAYQMEYGANTFEMKTDAFESVDCEGKGVILMDDLLATGGSILAAEQLVKKLGMEVADRVFIFDIGYLKELAAKTLQGASTYALVSIDEKDVVFVD